MVTIRLHEAAEALSLPTHQLTYHALLAFPWGNPDVNHQRWTNSSRVSLRTLRLILAEGDPH